VSTGRELCCCYNRNAIHIASEIFYFLLCSILQCTDNENSRKEDDILRYLRVEVSETADEVPCTVTNW